MEISKCKDCKYFKKSTIKAARTGECREPKHLESEYVKKYGNPWIGCGRCACDKFSK